MSRIKKVYTDPSQVAHLWSHQVQSYARTAGGNFYFNGDTIYSYGSHFPIARIVRNADGEKRTLFTTRSYSNTTARHIHTVRMAIPGSLTHQNGVFHVSNPCATNETILKEYAERIDDKARETCTSRRIRQETRDRLYSELLALIAEGNAFATWSKQRKRFKTPDMDSLKVSVARAELAKARAEDRERKVREKRNAERIAKLRAEWGSVLEAWKRGDVAGMIPYQFRELPEYMETAYLRVRGENVETSQGASFPVDHAVRAIRVIQRMMRNTDGNTDAPLFVRNGKTIRLGHYQVDRIDADGVIHAGCHKVSRSEFESIAQQLREQVEAISCKDSQVEEED